MSIWAWIGVGVVGLSVLSLVVGLVIARILGRIGEEVAQLLDTEPWASAPLTREGDTAAQPRAEDDAAPHAHDQSSRSNRP